MVTLEIKGKVRSILMRDARTRDNDALLCALIWHEELKKEGNLTISAVDFLKMYSTNKFTNYESVRRCRAKIQEEEPALRGETYMQRKEKGSRIKKDITDSDKKR